MLKINRYYSKLQGKTFVQLQLPTSTLLRVGHTCDSQYEKQLNVVDVKGRQHQINIRFCRCEPESCTLVRHRLWPGSPKSPVVAFHFDLMDLQRMLFLEAQVSVYAFCAALDHLHPRLPGVSVNSCEYYSLCT